MALLVVTSMFIASSVALAVPATAQSGSPNAPQITDTGADQPRTTQEDTPLNITGISVDDADIDPELTLNIQDYRGQTTKLDTDAKTEVPT